MSPASNTTNRDRRLRTNQNNTLKNMTFRSSRNPKVVIQSVWISTIKTARKTVTTNRPGPRPRLITNPKKRPAKPVSARHRSISGCVRG